MNQSDRKYHTVQQSNYLQPANTRTTASTTMNLLLFAADARKKYHTVQQ